MINIKTKKKRILIVEDSQLVVLELEARLKNNGYDIAGSAAGGEEAVSLARESKPDLILMDIMLEDDMNGIEAAAKIRTFSDTPIIYTTAYSDDETLRDLTETSPDAYLKKPYDDRELSTAILLALERHENSKKLKASEQKYRSLFDNSKDAIYVTDNNGRLLNINWSFTELFGIRPDDLDKKSIRDIFFNPDDLSELLREIDRLGFTRDGIVEMIAGDRSTIRCQITSSKLYDENTGVSGYQGIIRDMTYISSFIESQHDMILKMVEALARVIEVRDPYTAGHQKRVANISKMIAKELKLPKQQIEELEMAAMIHDLGKISVPAEILSKPTRLNEHELSIIKGHPQVGYEIISKIDFPFPLAEIIHQHHERYDGTGYPGGLKKDEIMLEARIISVADVVEAMGSHRPYRASLGPGKAMDEIRSNSGKLYDTRVANAFFAVFDSEKKLQEVLTL